MDVFDQAQKLDEQFRQAALNEHLAKNKDCHGGMRRLAMAGKRECRNCGNKIPKARLKVNPAAVRCIRCQDKWEKEGGIDD